MNKATITVTNQVQYNPGPDTFDLTINTTVDSNSNHKATISAFNASFYLLDTKPHIVPFIYGEFPETESAAVSYVNLNQVTNIANEDQFAAYNTLVLNSEEFQIGVRGNTHVTVSGLPKYSVVWDKVVTMKGE